MRIAKPEEDVIGKVAVNSIGRVAIITGQEEYHWGNAWIGIGFDGKGTWACRTPCIVAESAEEFRQKLTTRFNGKMSFND